MNNEMNKIISLRMNILELYTRTILFDEALLFCNETIDLLKQVKYSEFVLINLFKAMVNKGDIYARSEEYKQAYKQYEKCLIFLEEKNLVSNIDYIELCFKTADMARSIKLYDIALSYFKQIIIDCKLINDDKMIINTYYRMFMIYYELNDINMCKQIQKDIHQHASKLNDLSYSIKTMIYQVDCLLDDSYIE